MNQNEEDVIYFDPIFDYSEFRLENGHLYDCTIDLGDGQLVPAHQLILSTTSDFFFNAFTSGMSEQETRHVKLDVNPGNVFPTVLNWMYTGEIEITTDNVMALSAIAQFYGISVLIGHTETMIESSVREDCKILIKFIQDCFEMELVEELDRLVPLIAQHFTKFDIQELSDNLDVRTFCKIREMLGMQLSEKVACTTAFLGEYDADENERKILNEMFRGQNIQTIQVIQSRGQHNWIDLSLLQ